MTDGLTLTGLDAANPLGFMAALGTLEVADAARPAARPRLRFVDEGAWRPVIEGVDADTLVAAIQQDISTFATEPALQLRYGESWDLKPPPSVMRAYLRSLVDHASHRSRRSVDIAASFATDVAVDNNGNIKPTALHFTAGQQELLVMVSELIAKLERADVVEALFGPWRYARPLPVLGWDSTAARDYALRAGNPSKEKKCGVPGADWLAFRALPCFPVVPVGTSAMTTGHIGGWKTGRLRWPLWSVGLRPLTIRALLRSSWLTLDEERVPLTEGERAARGIVAVLEARIRRSDQGGYGSFAPAALR